MPSSSKSDACRLQLVMGYLQISAHGTYILIDTFQPAP